MPQAITIFDDCSPCPYLPGRTARLPIRWYPTGLSRQDLDRCFAEGDRRTGPYLYRTHCPNCAECQAVRLEPTLFVPRRTQRRIRRKGDGFFQRRIHHPSIDPNRISLFNLHRRERDLTNGEPDVDALSYEAFLVNTCAETMEFSFWNRDELAIVMIVDVGQESSSAVYCYFDPALSRLSPGTYAVLKLIEWAQQQHQRYLYLGYYVADSDHMSYKTQFRPHERLIGDQWIRFEN